MLYLAEVVRSIFVQRGVFLDGGGVFLLQPGGVFALHDVDFGQQRSQLILQRGLFSGGVDAVRSGCFGGFDGPGCGRHGRLSARRLCLRGLRRRGFGGQTGDNLLAADLVGGQRGLLLRGEVADGDALDGLCGGLYPLAGFLFHLGQLLAAVAERQGHGAEVVPLPPEQSGGGDQQNGQYDTGDFQCFLHVCNPSGA